MQDEKWLETERSAFLKACYYTLCNFWKCSLNKRGVICKFLNPASLLIFPLFFPFISHQPKFLLIHYVLLVIVFPIFILCYWPSYISFWYLASFLLYVRWTEHEKSAFYLTLFHLFYLLWVPVRMPLAIICTLWRRTMHFLYWRKQ